jgi:hypothetical protein
MAYTYFFKKTVNSSNPAISETATPSHVHRRSDYIGDADLNISQKKRKSYTIKQKQEAIGWFDEFGIEAAQELSGVNKKLIWEWKRCYSVNGYDSVSKSQARTKR